MISTERTDHRIARSLETEVLPVARKVLSKRFAGSQSWRYETSESADLEELVSDTVIIVGSRLRNAEANQVTDLAGFTATVAINLYHERLRKRNPGRWSLEGKFRYLAKQQLGIELGEVDGQVVMGRSAHMQRPFQPNRRSRDLQERPADCVAAALRESKNSRDDRLFVQVLAVLDWVGQPVSFNALLTAFCAHEGIAAVRSVSTESEEGVTMEHGDSSPGADAVVESREMLRTMWVEIHDLPIRQRHAILLNLRDHMGRGVLALLPLAGISSLQEIAACLELSIEDLHRIWGDLPLEDKQIAERLGITSQDVSNLRAVGRAKLKRRLTKAEFL